MQATYDYWNYIIMNAYKSSTEGFLKLLDVFYEYYKSTLVEGQEGTIDDFKEFINEIALDEIIREVNEDSEIWKMIEKRIA